MNDSAFLLICGLILLPLREIDMYEYKQIYNAGCGAGCADIVR